MQGCRCKFWATGYRYRLKLFDLFYLRLQILETVVNWLPKHEVYSFNHFCPHVGLFFIFPASYSAVALPPSHPFTFNRQIKQTFYFPNKNFLWLVLRHVKSGLLCCPSDFIFISGESFAIVILSIFYFHCFIPFRTD